VRLEGIDVLKRELRPADPFHAAHDLDQPAARGKPFLAQKQRLAPKKGLVPFVFCALTVS
jgi:hypothetical protein